MASIRRRRGPQRRPCRRLVPRPCLLPLPHPRPWPRPVQYMLGQAQMIYSGSAGMVPSLAAGANGKVYAVWESHLKNGTKDNVWDGVFWSTWDGQRWSSSQIIPGSQNRGESYADSDPAGNLYVYWVPPSGAGSVVRWDGKAWSSPAGAPLDLGQYGVGFVATDEQRRTALDRGQWREPPCVDGQRLDQAARRQSSDRVPEVVRTRSKWGALPRSLRTEPD